MPEQITVREVYQMFGEVKDEVHKASVTCQKTQTRCHDIINRLETDFQLHSNNTEIHCNTEKKNDTNKSFIKSFWLAVFSFFVR